MNDVIVAMINLLPHQIECEMRMWFSSISAGRGVKGVFGQ
jgi:hypothetical protein